MSDELASRTATPALWNYVVKVFRAMEDIATVGPLTPHDAPLDDDEPYETGLVYVGHLTGLFQQLEIPNPYYTSVTRALKAMGCVSQLRRGGGTSPSRWALLKQPIEEEFLATAPTNATQLKHHGANAVLNQRVRDMQKLIVALDARVTQLEKQVANGSR